jgi:MerR family transcriptional regulator, light-induced transcriptional regulator
MANIADFTDEPKYTIKNVASQTGIRPVTLRAWERRHEVLSPYRSDNRYRLYSDKDVAILRWLKCRVDEGISISNAVAELRGMASQEIWPDAIPTAPSRPTAQPSSTPPLQYMRRLSDALLKHDETTASDVMREAHALFDLPTVFMDIIVPTLVEIGEAWYNGRIRITIEHQASAFFRGKLLALLQSYPARRNAPYILVGCAPTEQHELGSLMLAVLLRSHGFRVEFLGPDIPLDDLVEYAVFEKPALIALSASTPPAALELKKMQEKLRRVRPATVFGFGGRAFDLNHGLVDTVPGLYLGNTLIAAVQTIRDQLNKTGKKAVSFG